MVSGCAVEGGWSRRREWEGKREGQRVDGVCVCVEEEH